MAGTTTHRVRQAQGEVRSRRDAGHTGVEMVVVLCLVGLLASMTAVLITGMRTQAVATACTTNAAALSDAAVRYFVVTGDDTIPATGVDSDRYERTLVEERILRTTSAEFDLDATGTVITIEESSC